MNEMRKLMEAIEKIEEGMALIQTVLDTEPEEIADAKTTVDED